MAERYAKSLSRSEHTDRACVPHNCQPLSNPCAKHQCSERYWYDTHGDPILPLVEYTEHTHPKRIKSDFHRWMIQYQPDVLVSLSAPLINNKTECPHDATWYWNLWTENVDRLILSDHLRPADRTTWFIAQEKHGGPHFHALAKFSGRLWRYEKASGLTMPPCDRIHDRCLVAAEALLNTITRRTPEVIGNRTTKRLIDVRPAWLPTDQYSHALYVLKERWHNPTDGLLILPA